MARYACRSDHRLKVLVAFWDVLTSPEDDEVGRVFFRRFRFTIEFHPNIDALTPRRFGTVDDLRVIVEIESLRGVCVSQLMAMGCVNHDSTLPFNLCESMMGGLADFAFEQSVNMPYESALHDYCTHVVESLRNHLTCPDNHEG